MPKRRQDMRVGSWDNITERCPGMTYRLAPWTHEELTAWLCRHQARFAKQYEGCEEAAKAGADTKEASKYAAAAVRCIGDLIARIPERWSVADNRTACDIAADLLGSTLPAVWDALSVDDDWKTDKETADVTTDGSDTGDIHGGK